MPVNDNLATVFARTTGKCHLCGKQLCFSNYGKPQGRGRWEVEHSIPRSKGGTDHGNNLFASCIPCNRLKGTRSTRYMRAQNGRTRAPYSAKMNAKVRTRNTIGGGLAGLGIALALSSNPLGLIVWSVTGGAIARSLDPDPQMGRNHRR